MPLTSPVYCNKVDELIAFPSQKDAKEWLISNCLDTSGTPILVPFKDENEKINFLRPSNPNILPNQGNESITNDANKDIRIIGAVNNNHIYGFIEKIKAALERNRVPHLNELEGDALSFVDHGFIIIYKKGKTKVGHQFADLFEEEKQSLLEKIKAAQINDAPSINPAEFIEKISTLALSLDIKIGMTYFVITDKNANQHVYRNIFKEDPSDKNTNRYFCVEEKEHESKRVKIEEHKSQDHHIIPFLIDWCKWTAFAAITAIGAGLILGIFIVPPIGTIAAAIVAVVTFVGMSSIGFAKADKNNPTTILLGDPEFEVVSEVTFSSPIKQRINHLKDFFVRKLNKAPVVPTENRKTEIHDDPIGIFTTIVSSTSNIPVIKSNPTSSINALVKSSLSLFTFFQENKLNESNNSSSMPLRNNGI
jgi:hypothetical protein